MLTKLMALTGAELKSRMQSIDLSAIKGRALRRKFTQIRGRKEGGFTLLELLVVVAILAAIAGTATIMLQDTDRKGSAAAHVAMMDELSKGIQTYRVLNGGVYPNNWDSLLQSADGTLATTPVLLSILSDDLTPMIEDNTLSATQFAVLKSVGIDRVRVVNTGATPPDVTGTCGATKALLQATINDKGNNVTAQNIYRPEAANGCGADNSENLAATSPVVRWKAEQNKRVNAYNTGDTDNKGNAVTADDVLVAFGIGPDATLFDPSIIGALSNVPVYRHVEPDEYNRFIVLFKVEGVGVNGQAVFQAIVDGAGDTKDEELGEVDNVRAT